MGEQDGRVTTARLHELNTLRQQRGLSEAEWEEVALLMAALGRHDEAAKALRQATSIRQARQASSRPRQLVAAPTEVTTAKRRRSRQLREEFRWWLDHGSPRTPLEFFAQVGSGLAVALGALLVFAGFSITREMVSSPAEMTSRVAQVRLVQHRLVPFTMANGRQAKMLLVDWQNTGNVPVRVVRADIAAYDASGAPVEVVEDWCIYAVCTNSEPGIAPGQVYREPNGRGFLVLLVFGNPVRCEVTITRAEEKVRDL